MPSYMALPWLRTGEVRHYMGTRRDIPADTQTFSLTPSSAEVYASPLVQVDSMRWLYLASSMGSYAPPAGGIATRSLASRARFRVTRL